MQVVLFDAFISHLQDVTTGRIVPPKYWRQAILEMVKVIVLVSCEHSRFMAMHRKTHC
jgi:hypothetical protein